VEKKLLNDLNGKWAGRIFGTNTGNLFLDIIQEENKLSGEVRINDLDFGVTIYQILGTTNGSIEFNIIPKKAGEGIQVSPGRVSAELKPDGSLEGTWETEIGTAGTFRAHPHTTKNGNQPTNEPEQIFNKTIPVGSVRLFKKDLQHLFSVIKKDFVEGRPIVNFSLNGSDITKYVDSFLTDIDEIEKLNGIKISIQEHESHGINRMVNIDLLPSGDSAIRVSGTKESWVLGKAEAINNEISRYQNKIITNYKKYGLNLNQIIFLFMLVLIPEITTRPKRLFFVASVFGILVFLHAIHSKITPNTLIFLGNHTPSIWARSWPTILSWLIAASSSVFAMWLFKVLAGS
jgi:hypothetical protein